MKKEVDYTNQSLEVFKKEWKKTGCTLMSDGWTDGKSRHLTNFLVNSPRGSVFLKSVDTSSIIKNSQKLFELLDSIVEEIGNENVVQVVTHWLMWVPVNYWRRSGKNYFGPRVRHIVLI